MSSDFPDNTHDSSRGAWSRRWPWLAAAALYLLFMAWHQPWLVAPLTPAEVDRAFSGPLGSAKIPDDEKQRLKAFFASDDGRSFYNLNLMKFKARADYPDGVKRPGIETGSDANDAYTRSVVPLLFKRGSYPVFASSKIANLLMTADPGADFFDEVGIVRYRSRRDMLEMILHPDYALGAPHKFASLDKNVALPTRALVAMDASIPVAMLLAFAALLAGRVRRPARQPASSRSA